MPSGIRTGNRTTVSNSGYRSVAVGWPATRQNASRFEMNRPPVSETSPAPMRWHHADDVHAIRLEEAGTDIQAVSRQAHEREHAKTANHSDRVPNVVGLHFGNGQRGNF